MTREQARKVHISGQGSYDFIDKIYDDFEEKYAELGKEIEALKNTEVKYPVYCKSKQDKAVIKFTGIRTGKCVVQGKSTEYCDSDEKWLSSYCPRHLAAISCMS